MECAEVRVRLFRRIDGELSERECSDFDDHLACCPSCAREYKLLTLPRRIAPAIPPVKASPFFLARLRRRIEAEARDMAGWQLLWNLERKMIPALAGITLVLISAFAYMQMQAPKGNLYQDYIGIFITDEQPHRMLAGDQGEITDASVLDAIAEKQ